MALNALRTEMVTFTGTPGFEANGVVIGYKAEYTQRTGTEAKYHAIEGRTSDVASDANHKGQYYIQLGEQLYDGKLKLNNNDQDVFGRPARKWEYDGRGIGTYAKTELLDKEYVGSVSGKDLRDLLGNAVLDQNSEYDVYCYIDGIETKTAGAKTQLGGAYFDSLDMNKNNKATIGGTGTGVKTEVYVDHEADIVYVVVVNTYLAIASKDYDTKKEEASLNAYAMKKVGDELYKVPQRTATGSGVTLTLPVEDFPSATEIKKDDPLLVQVADGEVQNYKHAEVLSGVTVTSFKKNDNVVTGGTKYSYTTTADYKWADDINKSYTGGSGITNLKDRSYNIYLDAYGNLIGIEEVEAKKNYVFITGIDLNGSNITNSTADANAIFLDGTMETIKVNMTKSTLQVKRTDADAILNTWCTFTKSGDVYTVKEVSDVGLTQVGGGIGDVTKYPSSTNGNLAQFNQTNANDMTVGGKYIRMYGGDDGATIKDYFNVYGDSDTVYLTAELGELQNSAGNYGVIDDVVSVTTGVANTSLTAYGDANALASAQDSKITGTVTQPRCSSGIYGLYNENALIIAAVVIGEDAGTAKDLVYVHSSGLEEEIDNGSKNTRAGNDDLWTWTRKVIRDGEEILLTEVGDNYKTGSSLADMEQYQWYEVRTNADGNVTKVVDAATALVGSSSRYVTVYSQINDAVEPTGVETVLYLTNGGPKMGAGESTDLVVRGNNTLAVEGKSGSGIHFKDDVNVTLQYWNKNTKQTDIMAGEGVVDLKNMVSIVNGNNGKRGASTYYISALIQNGRATDIVIYDSYNNYDQPNRPAESTEGVEAVVNNGFVDVTFTDVNYSTSNLLNAVKNALIEEGYTNINFANLTSLPADGANKGTLTVVAGLVTARDAYNTSDFFTVRYMNQWTLKVNGSIVEYVPHGANAQTTWKGIYDSFTTKPGTGVVKKIASAPANDVYVAYTTISGVTTTAVAGTETIAPMTIDSGYITIADISGTVNTSDTWAVNTDDYESVNSGAVNAVKVGTDVRVTYTTNNNAVSGDQIITMSFTGAGSVGSAPVLMEDAKFDAVGNKAEFTINTASATADITGLAVAIAAAPATAAITAVTVTAGVQATPVNGVWAEARLSSNADTAKVGDKVTVTVTLHGKATAATKVTLAGAGSEVEANSGEFPVDLNALLTPIDTTSVNLNVGQSLEGVTFDWTFEVAATGTIRVTVANNP